MRTSRTQYASRAFTLIELMVVVAIIGLLVGVLLPAFGAIRTSARNAQTAAQFSGIDSGISLYRNALGAGLPPSAGDDDPPNRQRIANPKILQQAGNPNNGGAALVHVTGAHLLFHALIGSDGLGTPGFKDLDGDGRWFNDTHNNPGGAYEVEQTGANAGDTLVTRYGEGGFVDDKMTQGAKSLNELFGEGLILNVDLVAGLPPDLAVDEPVFVDAWDHPILYYKAGRGSNLMIADVGAGTPGIYAQQDNGAITGSINGGTTTTGLDFGRGTMPNVNYYHAISDANAPLAVDNVLIDDANFADTFARFIADPTVTVRPTPIRRDSYLLISAGPDSRYGTEDDITNWTRKAP